MNYEELMTLARPKLGAICKGCLVCNGRACGNKMPGPGAKGIGDTAIRNYEKWKEIRINMDTLTERRPVDMTLDFFGKKLKYPIIAGPVGLVAVHYSDAYTDTTYNDVLVSACAAEGIVAMTGDGADANVMQSACVAIKKAGGMGIPTVKPWGPETLAEKFACVKESGCFACAMDVDGAGLPFLKKLNTSAGSKSQEELTEVIRNAGVPFIVKGIMTVKGALKAKAAGASAIVVSNHGGRVLDQCPATAEVLPEIVDAVQGEMKILVDGGIRSGVDIFKALAVGADAVIIARPFVTAVYGAGAEGVHVLVEKLAAELEDTMEMCGAHSLAEITRDMVRL
ncbi:MAG: alpha-hydroxy-acid oxidizing protein [Acidaminococcaceae bacterium]|nr:alpha-hydroxy-acid oxidizing protein [Acidaminococcaceae bacterium]